jgi:hypothetical protein
MSCELEEGLMRKRMLLISLLVATLGAPVGSAALTLQDLQLGASFTSTGGDLSFDFAPGSIALSGALPMDLSLFTVTPTADGFFLSGPLTLAGAGFAGLTLAYQVSAAPGLAIEAANLLTNGIAFGSGALALATTGFSNGASLGVVLSPGGGTGMTSNASFVATSVLDTLASLQLFGQMPGDVAGFGSVQHGFSLIAIAEPGTSLLLLAGIGGLALLGTRRRVREPVLR